MCDEIEIESREYWVKVVDFIQQNWALIDQRTSGVRVWFIHDLSGVFDSIDFPEVETAEHALMRNGFERYTNTDTASAFLHPPGPPFTADVHPSGKIYSSGRYWS